MYHLTVQEVATTEEKVWNSSTKLTEKLEETREKKDIHEVGADPVDESNALLYPPLGIPPQKQTINPIYQERNILNRLSSHITVNSAGQGRNFFGDSFTPLVFGQQGRLIPQESSRVGHARSLDTEVYAKNTGKFNPSPLEGGFVPSQHFRL